jgi:hypothetical protein
MTVHILYRGVWPQNVSKLAKYSIRLANGTWKISVLYEAGDGLKYLAIEETGDILVQRINQVKSDLQKQQGGAFYVNEYRHIIVPVASDSPNSGVGSYYYYAGKLVTDFTFKFEGNLLTTKPIRSDGTPLKPGDRWVGPRPGIPYVLAAGGGDIYYESPALTEDTPPKVRPMMTRKVKLSKVIDDKSAVARAVRPLVSIRGHQGGRFYVNEHSAMFTPIGKGDGNGIDYYYCGQIERDDWFPEPFVDSLLKA